jgi:hypothetical protein
VIRESRTRNSTALSGWFGTQERRRPAIHLFARSLNLALLITAIALLARNLLFEFYDLTPDEITIIEEERRK